MIEYYTAVALKVRRTYGLIVRGGGADGKSSPNGEASQFLVLSLFPNRATCITMHSCSCIE